MAAQGFVPVFYKSVLLVGAGYTTTVMIKNGKLSDLLGELQSMIKGLEKPGEQSDDYADAMAAQVRRLAMEVRQLASSRQITVLNGGDSGGKLTSFLAPAAAVGVLGYGYMWWKGFSYKDLLWVTKRNMAAAVENLSKHLESVSDALSAAKKHLTQRIQNLDDKMETQKEISRNIQASVEVTNNTLCDAKYHLDELHDLLFGLDGRMDILEKKQDFANRGVNFLVQMFGGKSIQMPDDLQEQLRLVGKSRNLLAHSETPSVKGLKDIADTLSESITDSGADAVVQDGIDILDKRQNSLRRAISAR
ncbi:hypothetical protein SLA2020_113130 [Shorea laevis]